jgi:hypothetical protein
MSLSGNLKTMDLAELLQWVAIGRKTGALAFIKDKTKNYIYFREGLIISSRSNEPTYQLGQSLLFEGKITEAQLKRAIELKAQTQKYLSAIMVQEGYVTEQEIQKAMVRRTEEVIYDLFLWEEGHFHFAANNVNLNELFVIKVDVNSVIFEGVRRKDEWARIRAVFPSNNITLALRPGADLKALPLTALHKKLLFLASSGKTIAEMILELHGSDFQVNFELFQLYDNNIVDVSEIREAPKKVEEPAKAFNQGVGLMEEKKYPEAISVFQKILRTDPQNLRAHEQIELAEKSICQDLYKSVMPPNRVPYFLVPITSLSKYKLTHQEGYIASRIDGSWDVKSIVMLSPLREYEVLQTLDKLIKNKLIGLK